jgi:hypothetical protein
MSRRHIAALAVAASVLWPSAANADRNLVVTPVPSANAPFSLYNCRGKDVHDVRHSIELSGYFSNDSAKDFTRVGVHFRLLRLDGSQIIGFTVGGDKRVTAGTKNSIELRMAVPVTGIDRAECAPSYVKFADGTEWRAGPFEDGPETPRPSPSPAP